MAELIVNPLSEALTDIVLETSGLEGGAVGIAPDRRTERIGPGEYAELGFSTWEEFQDMSCSWTLNYRVGEDLFRVSFSALRT